jgi:hypothetical protein
MRRSSLIAVLLAAGAPGCFLPQSSGSDGGAAGADGGYGPFTSPTLEVTVSGVHFGPSVPAGTASIVNTRDQFGAVTAGSFRLDANIGNAGCTLAFDRFGPSAAIGVGQYTVSSKVGSSTPSGIVYPTTGEIVATPEGNARCSGSDCDYSAFVINAIGTNYVAGYWMGTVNADSGAGVASVVCNFYVTLAQYQP